MELKISQLEIPKKITFNFDELKAELTTKVKEYESLVYSEEEIAFAKKDRATLNALKKALNDERIRQEKEYTKPFEEFKAQIKELCTIIDKGSASIDAQVKAFEEQQKNEKLNDILSLWKIHGGDEWMIRNDPKWLNNSVSLKAIEKEIIFHLLQVQKDLDTLDSLGAGYEAMSEYQRTLDLNSAIAADAKAKADADAKAKWESQHSQIQIEEVPVPEEEEPSRRWVKFQAFLSVDEATLLREFLKKNGIKFESIYKEK